MRADAFYVYTAEFHIALRSAQNGVCPKKKMQFLKIISKKIRETEKWGKN